MKIFSKANILYVIITVIFLVCFVGVLIYGYQKQEVQVWEEKQLEMVYIADAINVEMQAMAQSYQALTEQVAGVIEEAGFSTTEAYISYLQRFVAANKAAEAAYLALDNTVTYFDNWTAPEGYDPKTRAWYNQGKDGGGKVVFSDPYIDMITNQLVISCLKKVTMEDGLIGVVGVDISITALKDIVDAMRPTDNGAAYLLGPDTVFLTHKNQEFLPKNVNEEEVYTKRNDLSVTTLETSNQYEKITKIKDYDGIIKYNYTSDIKNVPGWTLGLDVPISDFEKDVQKRINSLLPFVMLGGIVAIYSVILAVLFLRNAKRQAHWYRSMLDSIPFPISVTDMNMNWTFINSPVEEMLNIKRDDVIGKPCSNWGAGICKTGNCGITCLRNGKKQTFFEQMNMDFQVDVSYLLDVNGKKIGHIELVQDISKIIKTQKDQEVLMQSISEVSNTFVAGSRQIASGAQSLAQGSAEQSEAVERLLGSIAQIAEKTKDNTERAAKAAALAETIKGNAEKGNTQMDQMIAAVEEINQASQSINKVIKVIDDIAFQTNILALNAAVEAARAGQHGKGFAVVAEEVRNLAAKSAEAAKDTGSLITNSMEKAELGARIAGETAASLVEIVSGINESNQLVGQIAESSEEESAGIMQINEGIEKVARVVQQNSATAQESAAASEEMNEQSDMLEELIAQFTVKEGISKSKEGLSAKSSSPKRSVKKISLSDNMDGFGKY